MKKRLALVIALIVIALAVVGVFLIRGQQGTDTGIPEATETPVVTEEPAVVESAAEVDFIDEAVANGRKVERTSTFKLETSTGDENVDQIISSLLDALSVVTYTQDVNGRQSGLRVSMEGTDILYVDVASANDQLYLRSDLLADGTIVAKGGDEQAIAEKVILTLKAAGIIDDAAADSALEEIGAMLSGASNPMSDVDFEAVMNGFDFTALQEFAEGYAEKIEQSSDLSGLPEGSDPAIMALTIKMSAEDIVKVYDIIFDAMRGNKAYLAMLDTMVVSVDGENMSAEDALNTMQEQLATMLPQMIESEIPLTLYLNGNDEVVAATLNFAMKASVNDGDDLETVNADFLYRRQTAEEQTTHAIVYHLAGESMQVVMTADIALKAEGAVDAAVSFEADGNVMTFTFAKDQQIGETDMKSSIVLGVAYSENGSEAFNVKLNVDTVAKKEGEDAEQTTEIALSLNGAKLATMTTQSKTGEPVESIAAADAIRLADLSQEDFQSWFGGVIMNLQTWAVTALQSLPSSVLMLFIQ